MTTEPPHWYQNPRIRRALARSEYITAFTNWFMGLAGRATELVLYATVLYSSAQLYPHVQLPASLSLAVFLIQMGALDVGGLALSKLAKQARNDGNTEGAEAASRLSQWLIGIMLAGVVTVGLEHALPFALPTWITVSIDVALVVARSICAVLYGRVVHDLKTDSDAHQADEVSQQVREQLTELAALPALFEQLQQEVAAVKAAHTEQQHRMPAPNITRPKLSVVEANTESAKSSPNTEHRTGQRRIRSVMSCRNTEHAQCGYSTHSQRTRSDHFASLH